jgi:ElaA protein
LVSLNNQFILPTYTIKHFADLTALEVYQLLQLRNDVFIMEQNCFYRDVDDKDLDAFHLLVQEGDAMIGYARLLPVGSSYDNYCSIGRVLVVANQRMHSYGKVLMQHAITFCKATWQAPIKISAQQYLEKFYTNLDFVIAGDTYLEDDIPHLPMVYKPK